MAPLNAGLVLSNQPSAASGLENQLRYNEQLGLQKQQIEQKQAQYKQKVEADKLSQKLLYMEKFAAGQAPEGKAQTFNSMFDLMGVEAEISPENAQSFQKDYTAMMKAMKGQNIPGEKRIDMIEELALKYQGTPGYEKQITALEDQKQEIVKQEQIAPQAESLAAQLISNGVQADVGQLTNDIAGMLANGVSVNDILTTYGQEKPGAGEKFTSGEADAIAKQLKGVEASDIQPLLDGGAKLNDIKSFFAGVEKGEIKKIADSKSNTGYSWADARSGEVLLPNAPEPRAAVNIQMGKPASPGERTALAESAATIDTLNNLKTLFDESFVGPLAGRAGAVKDLFGANDQAQSEFIAATSAFRNKIIKEITGAQMSEKEADRILKQVPDVNNPPSVWAARWNQSLKNVKNLQKWKLKVLKESGLKPPLPEAGQMSDQELLDIIKGN